MQTDSSLYSIIYDYLSVRIHFGIYKKGDHLPTLRELSDIFYVSPLTVTNALRRLESEGLITMPKAARAVVTVSLSPQELEHNLRSYICSRWDALFDLSQSIRYLFVECLSQGLYRCGGEDFRLLESYLRKTLDEGVTYLTNFLIYILRKLGNPMIIRLFLTANVFSYGIYLESLGSRLGDNIWLEKLIWKFSQILYIRRTQGYDQVQEALSALYQTFSSAHTLIGIKKSPGFIPMEQISFQWQIHKERPQICATLGAELARRIYSGEYPINSFLPSVSSLSQEFSVPVISVRRTIASLSSMGIVATVNGVGTRVTTLEEGRRLVDLGNRALQKNLIYYLKALQIITIICRPVALHAFPHMPAQELGHIKEYVQYARKQNFFFSLHGAFLKSVADYSEQASVREIFSRLSKLWIWGFSLCYITPSHARACRKYADIFLTSLDQQDASLFADTFFDLSLDLFRHSKKAMLKLGIKECRGIAEPHQSRLLQ